jgi:hypothetical protein
MYASYAVWTARGRGPDDEALLSSRWDIVRR